MSTMNKKRVQELIQAYGANAERWPQTERVAGQRWLADNPAQAQSVLAEAKLLDLALDTAKLPVTDTTFLQARILKAAVRIAQDDIPPVSAANSSFAFLPKLASWQSVAATLLFMTGIGFGIGQATIVNTATASAEALLSISMQSAYDEADLFGDEL